MNGSRLSHQQGQYSSVTQIQPLPSSSLSLSYFSSNQQPRLLQTKSGSSSSSQQSSLFFQQATAAAAFCSFFALANGSNSCLFFQSTAARALLFTTVVVRRWSLGKPQLDPRFPNSLEIIKGIMHFMRKTCHCLSSELNPLYTRHYASKIDWNKLRPIILNRIRNRVNDYPIKSMIPVAVDVLKSQEILRKGISFLLNVIPVKACNSCPEVYVGRTGHQIKTCRGFKQRTKNLPHKWTEGKLIDILPQVESYHLQHMWKSMIKHDQRFDLPRVPAILELCYQAGVEIDDEILYSYGRESYDSIEYPGQVATPLGEDIRSIALTTLDAWENLRLGLQKLLFVYPVKVCQHCSEVHVGPIGHKVRVCGLFKHESWRGIHTWKRAEVDDLVPPKMVWHQRPQDPPVLVDDGRNFYGHAPAVVELCVQAGARVPPKYFCMMKIHGIPSN